MSSNFAQRSQSQCQKRPTNTKRDLIPKETY